MKFLFDLFKPILTAAVTVVSGAFIVSVFWPAGDTLIESWVPAWANLDPAVAAAAEWLGLVEPPLEAPDEYAPETPWWRFWE